MSTTLPLQSPGGLVTEALNRFVADVSDALPDIIAGIVFLVIAGVGVKVIMAVVRAALRRTVPGESPVYRQFVATIVAVFLWFGVGLSFLSVVGLDGIATSLGTAAGFLALGVSYATSNMIADAVAGVYLLRDEDFNPGDTVDIGGTTGVVQSIELRKTRLTVDDDTVVRGNAEIEKKWTKIGDAGTAQGSPSPAGD
ncbi:mechanosensitive ion channel domain-containing protein [Halobaculum rubrum]|uniref:mechanosensitive ion channel domain-containing protein n=1 Tax=Halobaculum rubrum TaxID=2872158 RepID=UPI001CA3F56F|nr:mechanosensitive ion channel domain-containing protein [Halobaculum rubrum]QZX99591.1 mechanosensitive ion channel [Halobaculum rubrum]